MIEQSTDFLFGIGNYLLVNDTVNPSRQHAIEMGHECNIVAIHAPELGEPKIGVAIIVLELGKAAGDRMAPDSPQHQKICG